MNNLATVTALPASRAIPNCKAPDADPEDWFPHEPQAERTNERAAYVRVARKLCAGCPLAAACLDTELRQGGRNTHGIFGGTAPWERQSMRRRAQRHTNMAVAS